MSTACIQAKHKQKIIKVQTKCTTKPFELVHSDMFRPFSMLTSAGPRNYTLFIDDYTRYTFVCVLPDKQSKTCTLAYHTDIRDKETDLRYIPPQSPLHSRHCTTCGKKGRVDIRLVLPTVQDCGFGSRSWLDPNWHRIGGPGCQ